LKIISTVLSQAQAFVYSTTPTNSTAGAWCLREVMMALLLSSGRYSAEEIGESKGVFCTLLCFAGWSVHEDTNGYEAIHLLCSGRSSMEEICELNTAFCKLLGFAGWSLQEDTNG